MSYSEKIARSAADTVAAPTPQNMGSVTSFGRMSSGQQVHKHGSESPVRDYFDEDDQPVKDFWEKVSDFVEGKLYIAPAKTFPEGQGCCRTLKNVVLLPFIPANWIGRGVAFVFNRVVRGLTGAVLWVPSLFGIHFSKAWSYVPGALAGAAARQLSQPRYPQ